MMKQINDYFENAPVAFFSVGTDGRIQRNNRYAEELLGYSAGELVGHLVLELYAETPSGKEKARLVLARFRAGEVIHDEVMQMKSKSGKRLWVSLSVNAIRDDTGQIIQSRSVVIDITARKEAEEALLKKTSELQIMVNAMAGREVRMAGLKKVIKKLRAQLRDAGIEPIANDPLLDAAKEHGQ